tara:strand:+ start:2842 stop:3942 length:1101 start_codon:yes stop_codon:yes gene_type:complete
MVKKVTRKKVRKAPVARRTGIAAAPTDNWWFFRDYFRMELDRKEVSNVMRTYIRVNHADESKLLLSAPDYMYTMPHGIAASISWTHLKGEFPAKWDHEKAVANYINELREVANRKATLKVISTKPARTIADRMREITSDFIANVEEILDQWSPKTEFNLYNEMKIKAVSNVTAKAVLNYYTPLRDELQELVDKKTPDLLEAYAHMTLPKRKKMLAFVNELIADAERYIMGKKAVRKTSKPRVKTADRQIVKLNFLKESNEFKLTSINPMLIVGSRRLFAFNTRYKVLMEISTESVKGFEVSGSTIKNIDTVNSRQTTLRKPSEMLPVFQSKTIKQINKLWKTLTTKTTVPNGRINKDVILLRVMDT